MKRIFFTALILFFTQTMHAQFLEKVYLKDSITVYEGWIIEQVPQEYLKMLLLKPRDTITIDVADVWKIVRVLDPKQLSYFLSNELGVWEEKSGRSQAVYLELLGNGGLYSVNYDTRIRKGAREGLGFRIGFEYFVFRDSSAGLEQKVKSIGIPLDVNYLIGKRKGALEIGMGTTFFSSRLNGQKYNYDEPETLGLEAFNIKSNGFIGFANLGYRYRSANNGFMFKAAFTPIILPKFFPLVGLSFGYHFQKR